MRTVYFVDKVALVSAAGPAVVHPAAGRTLAGRPVHAVVVPARTRVPALHKNVTNNQLALPNIGMLKQVVNTLYLIQAW